MFNIPQNYEEKPYNMCLNCAHIGKNCDGPNFLAMSTERWCEWVRLRKEYLGWTNAKVAEYAEISKVSVDRIMSGHIKDIRTTTMQAVTKALVNGTWGQYPCALAAIEDIQTSDSDLSHECTNLKKELESEKKKVDFLKRQMEYQQEQLNSKDELLRERFSFLKRKDRLIYGLSIALAVILIIVAVDAINGNFGYFRY